MGKLLFIVLRTGAGAPLPPSDEGGAPKGRRERNVLYVFAFSLPQAASLTHSLWSNCHRQLCIQIASLPSSVGAFGVRCSLEQQTEICNIPDTLIYKFRKAIVHPGLFCYNKEKKL